MCVSSSRPPGKTRLSLRCTSETPKQRKYTTATKTDQIKTPGTHWSPPVFHISSFTSSFWSSQTVLFFFFLVLCSDGCQRPCQFCYASYGTWVIGESHKFGRWKSLMTEVYWQPFISVPQYLSGMSSNGSPVKDVGNVYLPALPVALSLTKFLLCLDSSLDFPLSFKGFMMQWFNKSLSFSSMHELTAWLNYGFHPCVEGLTAQKDWKELMKAHEMGTFALTFNAPLAKPVTQHDMYDI